MKKEVLQGDCLEQLRKIPSESVNTVITSPPYNKGYWNQVKNRRKKDAWSKAEIKYESYSDCMEPEKYEMWQKDILTELVRIIKKDGSIFYNHKPLIYRHKLVYPKFVFDFNVRQQIIWDRSSSPSIYPIRFLPTTEYVFWITKEAVQPKFRMPKKNRAEVWKISPRPNKLHPAPFPEEIVETCIEATTDEGDVILDPFAGSGTALVVAERMNRGYIGIEISEKYIEIINKRLENLTTQH